MNNVLPDIIANNLLVLFCGINPGLTSARDGHHFSRRSNRFWKALHLAGFTPEEIAPADDQTLLQYGYGLTTVVERPTTTAAELSKEEFTESASAFLQKIEQYQPRHIAFLGKAAYEVLSGVKKVSWGLQEKTLEGAIVWVLPNPSGLNRGFRLDMLVSEYKAMYAAVTEK